MGLAATIRQWHSKWLQAHELNALDTEQRQTLARDIGIPEDVLSNLAALGPKAGSELPRLMEALCLDVARIRRGQAALMKDMQVTCSQCPATARCRRHLDQGHARLLYSLYCPNADTLRELWVVEKPVRHTLT
jgi:hypothetical protein